MAKTSLEQSRALFGFLKDLLRLRNKPVKTISTYVTASGHWVHHLDETPATKNGVAFWGSIGLRAMGTLGGDIASVVQLGITTFKETKGSILRLPKITPPEPPQPSADLGPWIDGDIEFIFETPKLMQRIELTDQSDEQVLTEMDLKDHPNVIKDFESWLAKWQQWAIKSKDDLEIRKLYNALFETRDQIRDQSQDWEFILGIGRLRLGLGTDKEIDRHIFTVPCVIDLDSTTGTLFVRVDDTANFNVEDDWIQGFKKPELPDLEIVKEVLNKLDDLTDESIKKELIKLAHKFRADIVTDIDPVDFKKRDSLVLAPSLILRKRGKQDLIKLLETLETLFGEADSIPAPLQSLLEPGYGEKSSSSDWSGDGAVVSIDDSTYLPLALNSKQLKALERADTRNATIVQGPPGTGKTRTIAVMVSHFLAKGQRVLVAAQTPQALREVRSQLPEEIRELAVASLGGGKADNDDLQKAVNALVAAHEDRTELIDGFEKFQKEELASIDALHEQRAQNIRAIIDIRSQETMTIEIEGLKGSPGHLALVHLDQRNEFSWLSEVSDSNAMAPNYMASDAEFIGTELRRIWQSQLQVSSDIKLPSKEEIWPDRSFQKAQKLQTLKEKSDPELQLIPEYATQLANLLEPAIELQNTIEVSNAPWRKIALDATNSLGEATFISRLENAHRTLENLHSVLSQMGQVTEIECDATSLEWLPILDGLKERVSSKGALKISVTGSIKKPLVSNSLMKNALPILNQVKILGKSPSRDEDFDRIRAVVQFDQLLKTFLTDLELTSETTPSSRYDRTIWLNDQGKVLEKTLALNAANKAIKEFLKKKLPKTNKYLHQPLNLDQMYDSALAINAVDELKEYDRKLNTHIAKLQAGVQGQEPDYVSNYVRDIRGSDFETFSKSRLILESHVEQLESKKNLIEYVGKLSAADHLLVRTFTNWVDEKLEAAEEHEILGRVNNLVDAFKWKRLGEALGNKELDDYGVLFRAVTRCDDQIEKRVRELSRRRSWKKALERIDATTITNMNRYALESKKLGAGTGITAARRKRDIRNYLTSCIPAIPAWIMPIDRVAQFFPAQLEMFDVVIVDEASQARLDSVFLLALSKRVVIVGDHKQVSPDGGMLPVAEIEQIVNRHLSDSPRKANWSNADLSLFDECRVSFGNMVTLTEHRRCVPEIIGFSNQIAYIPENIRLIPVRQTGTDALPPIKTIFVEKGFVRGSAGQYINQPEAEAVAQEVLRMTKDPAYRDMTIGIVTLQGSKQQETIRTRLIDLIPPSEMESRQIRVGMPPDFQGSERNVVLLSMVMAPNQRFTSQTKDLMVQRYNVAASRAKDQMVLVHSLRATDIKNTSDLRRQLIDYCQNVEKGTLNPVEGAIGQVPNDELVEPFDSLFEQRVHNRIVERGYKVIPQFEPQIDGPQYRIDLVVVGPYGKYAIECDGDFWHGDPEAFEKDLVRQEILQRCGWKFFRIPESRFYGDPTYMDQLWPELEKFVATKNVPVLPLMSEALNPPTWEDLLGDQINVEIDEEANDPEYERSPSLVDFNPDDISYPSAGESGPREIYIDGLRVREFPKPLAREFSWLQSYQSWDREDVTNLSKISRGNWKIMNELKEIIKIEGPILGSYLMRRHYKATGGSSLSSNNEHEYVEKLKSLVLREEVIMEEQVSGESIASASFRSADQPPVITRVRGARDLYDIPPREIAMIIRGVMKSRPALSKANSKEDLFRQVLLLLDFTKLTKKAEDHLTRIMATYNKEIVAK
jgi:very-short-patch-repair endonuclease